MNYGRQTRTKKIHTLNGEQTKKQIEALLKLDQLKESR
jgi:hypothetical protein